MGALLPTISGSSAADERKIQTTLDRAGILNFEVMDLQYDQNRIESGRLIVNGENVLFHSVADGAVATDEHGRTAICTSRGCSALQAR